MAHAFFGVRIISTFPPPLSSPFVDAIFLFLYYFILASIRSGANADNSKKHGLPDLFLCNIGFIACLPLLRNRAGAVESKVGPA
jgi:hypothetical protein